MTITPFYNFDYNPLENNELQNISNTQLIEYVPVAYKLPDFSYSQFADNNIADIFMNPYQDYQQPTVTTITRTVQSDQPEETSDNKKQSKESTQEDKQDAKELSQKQEGTKTQSENDKLIDKIINTARQYLGGKYVWGGKRPESGGFDCSGLLYYSFKQNGVKLGSSSYYIFKEGQEVKDLSQAKPGDIICTTGNGPTRRHVKMISKIVNGKIYTIEAKGRRYGIVEEPLKNTKNIKTIRRIIPSAKKGTKLLRKPKRIV